MRAHVCVNSKQARRRNAQGRKTLYSAIHHSVAGGNRKKLSPHYGPAPPFHSCLAIYKRPSGIPAVYHESYAFY